MAAAFFEEAAAPEAGIHTAVISSEELNRFVAGEEGQGGLRAQRAMLRDYHRGTERYWTARMAFLRRLRDAFDRPPEVWITLRRPDRFCMSMYQQVVRNRPYIDPIEVFAASGFALFDYERQLDQWHEVFGSVRIFVYEDAMRRPGRHRRRLPRGPRRGGPRRDGPGRGPRERRLSGPRPWSSCGSPTTSRSTGRCSSAG